MKNLAIVTLVAFSLISAQAETDIFNPDPSTSVAGGAPLTETLGTPYTQTVNGGATISYSPSSFTVTDGTGNAGQAYITSTEHLLLNTVYTNLTFTPTYSATDPTGGRQGQSNTTIFELEPSSGSNNDVLGVTFQTSGFGNDQANILLSSGIAYGGQSSSGASEYSSHGINSLSGVTLTLNLKTVFVTDPSGLSTVTTTGTLSDAVNSDLQTFDYVTSESNVTTGYDPSDTTGTGGLIYRTGLDSTGADTGFLNAPVSITFTADKVYIPEPSTYALMLGGLFALALTARRRFISRQ